ERSRIGNWRIRVRMRWASCGSVTKGPMTFSAWAAICWSTRSAIAFSFDDPGPHQPFAEGFVSAHLEEGMVHQVPQLLDFFRSVFPTQGQHGGENRFGREVFADEGTVLNQLLLTVELDPYRELGALAQENRHRLGADNQQVFCEFASERAQMGGVANSVGSQEPCPVSDGIRGVTASTRIVKLDEAWAEHLRRFPAPEPSTAGALPVGGVGDFRKHDVGAVDDGVFAGQTAESKPGSDPGKGAAQGGDRKRNKLSIAHCEFSRGGFFSFAWLGSEHLLQGVFAPASVAGGLPQRTLEALPPDERIVGAAFSLNRQVEDAVAGCGAGMQRGFRVQVQQKSGHVQTPVRTTPNPAVW